MRSFQVCLSSLGESIGETHEYLPVIWLQLWTEAAGADTALYLSIYFLLGLSATASFLAYVW